MEVAVPSDAPEGAGFIDGSGFGGQGAEREVDRIALGGESIAPHDFGARLIVDVYVGYGHAHTILCAVSTGKAGKYAPTVFVSSLPQAAAEG